MKFKRIAAGIVICSMLCGTSAFAKASKSITKTVSSDNYSARQEDDIYFEDFSSVSEGTLPNGYAILGAGNVSTEKSTVFGGKKKNCLVIDDIGDGETAGVSYNFGSGSGEVGIEARVKFVKTGDTNFTVFNLYTYNGSGEKLSEGFIPSSGGPFLMRVDGLGYDLMKTPIQPDQWYSIKYNYDFSKKTVDACIIDCQNSTQSGEVKNIPYITKNASSFDRFALVSENFTGKWIIDYIRVYKGNEMLAKKTSGAKGETPVYTPAPVSHPLLNTVNIKLDGKYKYSLVKPELVDEKVFAELRSAANIFGMTYSADAKGYTVTKGDTKLFFSADGLSAKNGNTVITLSAPCFIENGRIFVPLADFAEALGFKYSYDSEANEAVIVSSQSEQ